MKQCDHLRTPPEADMEVYAATNDSDDVAGHSMAEFQEVVKDEQGCTGRGGHRRSVCPLKLARLRACQLSLTRRAAFAVCYRRESWCSEGPVLSAVDGPELRTWCDA